MSKKLPFRLFFKRYHIIEFNEFGNQMAFIRHYKDINVCKIIV